jgi:hypothetical protein
MTQETLAYPAGLRCGAALAPPGCGGGGLGTGSRGTGRGAERRVHGQGLGRLGDGLCPCHQWSRSRPCWATLVRHVVFVSDATITVSPTTQAPTPGPLGMGKPAAPGALVSTGAVAPGCIAGQSPAGPAAVAVATVTVAAQHDLRTAMRAQEQAGRTIHAHLANRRCWTDSSEASHTAVAPPSSARCRARYGHQASRHEGSLPRPPASAWALLYPGRGP